MQMQRNRDTVPELAIRRILHARGLRYRVDQKLPIAGVRRRADLVFSLARVAVFVDGCFWHGCPEHGNFSVRANTWYWPEKIARNKARDSDTNNRLQDLGWLPIRIWEHEQPIKAADLVEEAVRTRRATSTLDGRR